VAKRLPGWFLEKVSRAFRLIQEAYEAEDLEEADEATSEAKELIRQLRLNRRRLPGTTGVYVDALSFLASLVDRLVSLRFATTVEGLCSGCLADPEREEYLLEKTFEAVRGVVAEYLDELLSLYTGEEDEEDEEEGDDLLDLLDSI